MRKLPPDLRAKFDDSLAAALEEMLAPLSGKKLQRALSALSGWRDTHPTGTAEQLRDQARKAIARATTEV